MREFLIDHRRDLRHRRGLCGRGFPAIPARTTLRTLVHLGMGAPAIAAPPLGVRKVPADVLFRVFREVVEHRRARDK